MEIRCAHGVALCIDEMTENIQADPWQCLKPMCIFFSKDSPVSSKDIIL